MPEPTGICLAAPDDVERRYRTIVIDPPWDGPAGTPKFGNNILGSVIPYHTMSGAQIATLRIAQLAEPDAMVFLWTTSLHIGDAYLHLQTWGFKYRALFIWKKPGLGLGLDMRSQSEFLLWGARKGAKRSIGKACPRQIQEWPNPPGHSVKPDEAYAFIEQLSEPPRLDIFARKRRPGWDVFGDEIDSSLGLTALG